LRCLRSTIALVETLISINDKLALDETLSKQCHEVREQLQLFKERLEGHVNATEILEQRVQATLGLVSNHNFEAACNRLTSHS